jgi:hypothetical protein
VATALIPTSDGYLRRCGCTRCHGGMTESGGAPAVQNLRGRMEPMENLDGGRTRRLCAEAWKNGKRGPARCMLRRMKGGFWASGCYGLEAA